MRRTREQLALDEPRGCRTFWALDQRARDNSVSLEARALWRIIDSYANRYGEGAFPSVAKLCSICGRDRKAIHRYLLELENAGWLARFHMQGRVNYYTVIYPAKGQKTTTRPVPKLGTTTYAQIGNTIP